MFFLFLIAGVVAVAAVAGGGASSKAEKIVPSAKWHERVYAFVGGLSYPRKDGYKLKLLEELDVPPIADPTIAAGVELSIEVAKAILNGLGKLQKLCVPKDGKAELVATAPAKAGIGVDIHATLTWGRVHEGRELAACGRQIYAGARFDSGPLPKTFEGPAIVQAGAELPHARWCAHALGASLKQEDGDDLNPPGVDSKCTWVWPTGPVMPELGLAFGDKETTLVLWLPPRDERWWYKLRFQWKETEG